MNTGNETVDYLSKIDFVGNVIPNNWFNFIKFESGKVDINSILILSEIVYWHRPSVMKDEVTGKFLGYKKRFKSDKLQKNYESLANQFGLTKRQVKEATDRLEEMNLIEKEFRNIKTQYGQPINNVLYFSLNHLELERITFGSNTDLRSNVTYPTSQSMTNTVITTENKTDILKDISQQSNLPTKKVKYDESSPYYGMAKYLYDKMLINNPKAKEPNYQTWSDDFRKIMEIDDRDALEVKDIIDFSQNDSFWCSNILSPAKLRKQYDQLLIKMNKAGNNKNSNQYQKQDAMSLMLDKFENGGFGNEQREDEPRVDRILIP